MRFSVYTRITFNAFLVHVESHYVGAENSRQKESPAFDCAKARTSAEKLICEDADLAKLDHLAPEHHFDL
jgi:uncharacterized protein